MNQIGQCIHSVPSYKKRSYKKQLVDSIRHKKRLYKDTEKVRNTSVKKLHPSEKDVKKCALNLDFPRRKLYGHT